MSASKQQPKQQKKRASKRKAAAPAKSIQIPVVRILNPFNPREFVREELTWGATKTLADYFPDVPSVAQMNNVIISINGKIVKKERFGVTYLDKTDNLVICPIPTGGGGSSGGGGKMILEIVAMIALAVCTAGAGTAAMAAAGVTGTAATVGAAIVNAGIMMAGSMLIHSVLATSSPTQTASTSSTYGIDGAKTTSTEGLPVPVSYGTFRTAGNIVDMYVNNDGNTQQLYMLLAAGEGVVSNITDIEIDNNPIIEYVQIQTEIRLGLPSQSVIPWFSQVIAPFSISQEMSPTPINYTTTGEIDSFRADIAWPAGLYRTDQSTGAYDIVPAIIAIQYSPHGENNWQYIPAGNQVIGWRAVNAVVSDSLLSGLSNVDPNNVQVTADGVPYVLNTSTGLYQQLTPNYDWTFPAGATDPNGVTYADAGDPVTDPTQIAYLNANYAFDTANAQIPLYGSVANDSTNSTHGSSGIVGGGSTAGSSGGIAADIYIQAAQQSELRASFSSGPLPKGIYDIRLWRPIPKSTDATISDDMWITDINEIINQEISYSNTALLAVFAVLGTQITSVPNVTFLHHGILVNVWGLPGTWATQEQWYQAASSNPAWILWDMLTNTRYGASIPEAQLDLPAFQSWAAYCTEEGLNWNGPFDTASNIWDAAQMVLRVGHAQIVSIGTIYSIITEAPSEPVMMFSVANMIQDSYTETWMGTADRATEIDVTYFDKTNYYQQKTVKVYDPTALAAGRASNPSAITLYGVTDVATAYKEAQFMLNLNLYILKTVTFSAPMEAVACNIGDLIYVQHDMPNFAQAGRFEGGSTTSTVNLDRPVTMNFGVQYILMANHDTCLVSTGTITNIAGDTIFLTGFAGTQTVTRFIDGAIDVRVSGTFEQPGGGYGVTVDSAAGLTVGDNYSLYDTDFIETANVVNTSTSTTPVTTSVVTLQTPLTQAPSLYANWMFGDVTKAKQLFRVTIVAGSQDYRRDITALQYNPLVYDFTRYGTSSPPMVPTSSAAIGEVTNLNVFEDTYVAGSTVVSEVVATWIAPVDGMYAGADIWIQRNGGAYTLYGSAPNVVNATISAVKNDILTVTVVAYDVNGVRVAMNGAPSITYTVIGLLPTVAVGGVTGTQFLWVGQDLILNWNYNSTTSSYEFGSEPAVAGAGAGSLDPQFQDYQVQVYDKTGTILRRTEHVTANSYEYTYAHNFADGLERYLQVQIRMRDTSNNLGAVATVDCLNTPPSVTSVQVSTSFESASISYTYTTCADFAGAMVWLSQTESDVSGDITSPAMTAFKVFDGPDAAITLTDLMFAATYYYRIAAYDVFGETELLPYPVQTFNTTNLNVAAIAAGAITMPMLSTDVSTPISLITAASTTAGSVAAQILAAATTINSTISTLAATVSGNTAAITSNATAAAGATGAVASSLTTLTATVAATNATVASNATAAASATAAVASNLSSLSGTVGANSATIVSNAALAASATGTVASNLSALTTTVGANTASVATLATSTAGLDAQYTVKVDVNGYVAGFGLASTAVNGAPTSEFLVRADSFAVVMPSYASVAPFTIGAVGGVPEVIISSALIGDASISNAKIGSLAVNTINIAGNAVTVPYGATGTGSSPASVTVVLAQPGVIQVLAFINFSNGSTGSTVSLAVSMNSGTGVGTIGTSVSPGYSGCASTSAIFGVGTALPAGTYTFTLSVGLGGATLGTNSIVAIGIMK